MRKTTQYATFILAASLAAMAQSSAPRVVRVGSEWVEETTGTLAAGKVVRVKTTAGSIKVQGGEQNNVTYVIRKRVRARSEEEAHREFALLRINATASGDIVLLRADGGKSRGSADFDVHAPRGTMVLRLDTDGGAVMAANITGQVEANTAGGAIRVDQIGGVVVIKSGGGDIEVGKTNSDVQVETGGGNIHVVAAGGNVRASSGGGDLSIGSGKIMVLDTGGGSIRVAKCTGQIKASTGGGNLDLIDIGGAAQIESGGGAIHIGPIHGGVRAETGAGAIVADLTGVRDAFSNSHLETSVGDIVVYLPDDLRVTVSASVEAARGKSITSEFPGLVITRSGDTYGPLEVFARGSLNGGGPLLHVHTVSGNIEFKHKKK
jgi:hypothetical protein